MGLEARPVHQDRSPCIQHAILASNTLPGLSITKLSEVLPESIKPPLCGIHSQPTALHDAGES